MSRESVIARERPRESVTAREMARESVVAREMARESVVAREMARESVVAREIAKDRKNFDDFLSYDISQENFNNRQMFMKTLDTIHYLARQDIPLQGEDEQDGNFIQLMKSYSRADERITAWLERKKEKLTTPSILIECQDIMAKRIVQNIAVKIKKEGMYYTIIIDQLANAASKSQFTLCIRWVDDELEVHEDFIGLFEVERMTSDTIYNTVTQCLDSLDLPLQKCRGQCYDGAGEMMEARTAIAERIKKLEPRAMFTHCYGHSLQLGVADAVKSINVIKNSVAVTREIGELVKQPTKRDTMFRKIKDDYAPEVDAYRTLCQSRHAVRASSFQSVVDNWNLLNQLWEELLEMDVQADIRGRVVGVHSQMKMFEHLFGIYLGTLVLKHSDNLSRTLQRYMSAQDGSAVSQLTLKTIEKMRSEENFLWFWRKCIAKASELNIGEPTVPERAGVGAITRFPTRGLGKCQQEVEDYFKEIYYQSIDVVVGCINDRVLQKDYLEVYKDMEHLLVQGVNNNIDVNALASVMNFYEDDLNEFNLCTQLELLPSLITDVRNINIMSIRSAIKNLPQGQRSHFSEIVKLLRLILVAPPTNIVSQESVNALKRVKNYLKRTGAEQRSTRSFVLSIHKEGVDGLKLEEIANEFCGDHKIRLDIFGCSFSDKDIPVYRTICCEVATQTEIEEEEEDQSEANEEERAGL